MLSLLANFEQNPFSVWMRESPSLLAFPFILYLHTLGLAMLAGVNVGLNFWLLARGTIPSFDLNGLYRIMWAGFAVNLLSGLALLAAYPAKALTNWVFFLKLTLVVVGVFVLERLKGDLTVADGAVSRAVSVRGRRLAMLSLFVWAGTIFAGRLLAYTHHILLASDGL